MTTFQFAEALFGHPGCTKTKLADIDLNVQGVRPTIEREGKGRAGKNRRTSGSGLSLNTVTGNKSDSDQVTAGSNYTGSTKFQVRKGTAWFSNSLASATVLSDCVV